MIVGHVHNLTIGYHNVGGLHNKQGCKIPDLIPELLNGIEIWSEIWACNCDVPLGDYDLLDQIDPQKRGDARKGRKSGGIRILTKKYLTKHIRILNKSNNFIWMEVNRDIIKNLPKNLIICAAYIHDATSKYFTPSIFDELAKGILTYCEEDTPLIITGDLNARTSTLDENFDEPIPEQLNCYIETNNPTNFTKIRHNSDIVINSHGKTVIDICKTYNLKILNGRMDGDGNFTYYDASLGASTVDYSICNQSFYNYINNFMTLPQNELSDHCKIVTEINGLLEVESSSNDSYEWKQLEKTHLWNEDFKVRFVKFLGEAETQTNEINQRIEAGLIESSGILIQKLFQSAAESASMSDNKSSNLSTSSKKLKRRPKTTSKIWFDTECKQMKNEVRYVGKLKREAPTNTFLREVYLKKMKDFKRTCTSKRYYFWKNKFEILEKSLSNPKSFWENWKKCSETPITKKGSKIDGLKWYKYFSELHDDSNYCKTPTPLPPHNNFSNVLNEPFTKKEFTDALNNLKPNKAAGFDRISNEMLKNSPVKTQNILFKYLNICLKNGLVSESNCYDLINPILKEGSADDPNNYRGICVSSAFLKLMCSMISNRLQTYVDENGLLNKNQIGFKRKSRTSDHLLTVKSLVKKYVSQGKKKLYSCFVDFRKAFDSVGHNALFHKLELLGINGNLLNLIKSIYCKTKCAVKVGDKITNFFSYKKGVRQGCPLSPLLFNLFVNDIFKLIDDNTKQAPELEMDSPINVLMYADDLVIFAHSEEQLQSHMSLLSEFCLTWNLQINIKKTKTMVFNRGNKLCNTNIYINDALIKCVKEFKYLGFTIGAKNCNLSGTIKDLKTKADRAIFALNNKIKISKLPTNLAIKIFNTQIKPILLYGAEVWAPYSLYNYDNWDTSETEKCHTQFLKRIMGCDIHSPNLMIRGELGVPPLLTDIICRSISFVKHLDNNAMSLASQSLSYELRNTEESNLLNLIRLYKADVISDHTINQLDFPKSKIRKQCFENYQLIWINRIKDLPKAISYNLYKFSSTHEKYISVIPNQKHKTALCRLRVSSHNLMIEKGRHARPKIEREDRKCPLCTQTVEDECHFIINCPLYDSNRNALTQEVKKTCLSYDQMNDIQKFIFVMSNENENIIRNLAKYVFNSMKKRNEFLNPNTSKI